MKDDVPVAMFLPDQENGDIIGDRCVVPPLFFSGLLLRYDDHLAVLIMLQLLQGVLKDPHVRAEAVEQLLRACPNVEFEVPLKVKGST